MLSFKPAFSLSSFTLIKTLLSSSSLSATGGIICISEVVGISAGTLDSSLCFIQPRISYDVCFTFHQNKIPPFCSICVWGLKFYNVLVPCWLSSDLQGPCSCGSPLPVLWLSEASQGAAHTGLAWGFLLPQRAFLSPPHLHQPRPALQPQLFPETIHPW